MRLSAPRLPLGLLVAGLVLAGSCGGESSPTSPIIPALGWNATMSANVDGVVWGSTNVGVARSNGSLIVSGTDQSFRIGFAIVATAPGTYSVTAPGNSATLSTPQMSGYSAWTANSEGEGTGAGSVTVQYMSSTGIAGSFSFSELVASPGTKAVGVRKVTQGQFNVAF